MSYLPIGYQIKGARCLVVGGGKVATRRVEQLHRFGAQISVVAKAFSPDILLREEKGQLNIETIELDPANLEIDLVQYALIVVATDNSVLDSALASLAKAVRIPVNVASNAEQGTVIFPLLINRTPAWIAVFTGLPVLTRLLVDRLETFIPNTFGTLAELAVQFRNQVLAKIPDQPTRQQFWQSVLVPAMQGLRYPDDNKRWLKVLERQLSTPTISAKVPERGVVYLVGAGPGEIDLLTFRALHLIQQADVVLYDRLVSQSVLDLLNRDTKRIFVGKQPDQHILSQEEINILLVDYAKAGHRVLRLKGGDPFMFGRGGEEIASLSGAGVPFQIVPGVTAASGCASYAGIPLTHREYAHSCLFVTGHLKERQFSFSWDSLCQPRQTLVVYMGIHSAGQLCQGLIEHGSLPTLPAAVIEQGTMLGQHVYVGDIQSLPKLIEDKQVKPPGMIIIGEVVRLHQSLTWYHPDDDQ